MPRSLPDKVISLTVTHAAALQQSFEQPSRKRSRQKDGSETSSAKKPKQSSAKKGMVRMRWSTCGKCVGCQPINEEDCGECIVCR